MSYDPIKDLSQRQSTKKVTLQVTDANMQKLFRRAEKNLRPPRWTRWTQLLAYGISAGATWYAVMYYDPGYSNHCYMPLRRWVWRKQAEFWSLDETDKKELEEQGRVW